MDGNLLSINRLTYLYKHGKLESIKQWRKNHDRLFKDEEG